MIIITITILHTSAILIYRVVSRLYSASERMINILLIQYPIQDIRVSLCGSTNVFLKLGIYHIVSIHETRITAHNGLSTIHHNHRAMTHHISIHISSLVISLVPCLIDNMITTVRPNKPIVGHRLQTPPPPTHIPATPILCVINQMIHV